LTLKEFGDRGTVWVGPIQGGLFADLVRRSAKSLVGAGFEFLALGSPVQVMENYMFADLVGMIVAARSSIPYSVPLHLFGAGHPLTMSLAVALGCDTFDSASYVIFARSGRYLSRGGVLTLQTMKYLPCSCPVCSKETVKSLLEVEHPERTRLLATHNLWVLREELEACKEAIVEGRLWDLVEERSMAHPRLREAFLEMGKHSKLLAKGTPAIKDRGLFFRSATDLQRPELGTAARRLAGAMRMNAKTASLAMGGPARRSTKGKVRGDEYIGHPIFGPIPVELEFQYPFSQSEAGAMVPAVAPAVSARKLKSMGYNRVRLLGETGEVRSRRNRRASSPSPRSSSARSR